MIVRKTSTKAFNHITTVEISNMWNIFIPGKEHFKRFMKKMGVSIIGSNQCFADIVCLNNWVGTVTDRTLFHVQSLETDTNDREVVHELDNLCDITLPQFFELLKIHGRNRQYCGLNTDGKSNVVYIRPPKVSSYNGRLCAIFFSHTGGNFGGWVLNGIPVDAFLRSKGTHVISRCFANKRTPQK